MANRTNLPITNLPGNTGVVTMLNDGTGMTATDASNGMSITMPTGIPAKGQSDRLVLLVLNTNGTGRTVTIRQATSDGGVTKTGAGSGNGPAFTYPSFRGSLGDMVTSAMTATTGLGIIGPFEVARFLQPDGTISIDFSGATGFIAAFLLARAFPAS